ncbi:MAG: proton-conducting transporter membrane subunit [Actinomycetota bacterium]|nr:proton-conducting transporter membrane subunit [Actinomycetota bacterium]
MSAAAVAGPVTGGVSNLTASLPLVACLVPAGGALVAGLLNKREKLRNAATVLTTLATFLVLLMMYNPVVKGVSIKGHTYLGIERVYGFLNLGFKVDPTALLIALTTSFLWLLSSIYAVSYMSHEHARTRYATFVLLTLSADLGVLLSRDFLSLFIFFEMLGLFSVMLVIHEENEAAFSAGKLYLWFGIIFGLALLVGILLLFSYTGQLNIMPMAELIQKTVPTNMRYIIAACMVAGFGAKAGVFFLHVWLPEAHPVAPTPASMLLSGVMIKAGAYGIIRSINTLYTEAHPVFAEAAATHSAAAGHVAEWTTKTTLGYALLWLGIITMFFGVVNALLTANCKRMLAYHSVSQMGYIVFGFGCAAYLGADGAMGFAGGIYHIVNHALFKALLFMSIGAVYFRTHELDMYKLGGLWRNMPIVAIACLIAVFGIAGVPFFNGFASKTLLHHAIFEAFDHSAAFSAVGKKDILLLVAEIIFMLTAFGTFCSNFKMWLFVFIWKRPEKYKDVEREPIYMTIALVTLASVIIFIGMKPNWMIESFIGPALAYFGYNPASHPYHILFNTHAAAGEIKSIIPLWFDPVTKAVFSNADALHNILGSAMAVMGGGMYFVLGYRIGLFHIHPPEWISVRYWYLKISAAFLFFNKFVAESKNSVKSNIETGLVESGALTLPKRSLSAFDRIRLKAGSFLLEAVLAKMPKTLSAFDRIRLKAGSFLLEAVLAKMPKTLSAFDRIRLKAGSFLLEAGLVNVPRNVDSLNNRIRRRINTYLFKGKHERRREISVRVATLLEEQKIRGEIIRDIAEAVSNLNRGLDDLSQRELHALRKVLIQIEEPLIREEHLSRADLSALRYMGAAVESNPNLLSKEDVYWLNRLLTSAEKTLERDQKIIKDKLNRLQDTIVKLEEISKMYGGEGMLGTGEGPATLEELRAQFTIFGEMGMESMAKAEDFVESDRIEQLFQRALFEAGKAQLTYKILTYGVYQEMNWIRRMILAGLTFLSEKRFAGAEQALYAAIDVEETRDSIRSYTRDIGTNILIMISLLLVIAGSLLYVRAF